jgi:type II secretory pathway component PulM
MQRSEELNELFAALSIAQGQIEDAAKSRKNDFYKSSYADLSSVRSAVRQPLADNGLSISQWDSVVPGGVEVLTVLGHKSGQWMSGTLFMPVKHEPHPIGSGISYARRYSLMSIMNLAADDDDGNAAQTAKPIAEPDPKVVREMALRAKKEAEKGIDALNAFWRSLEPEERKLLTPEALKDLKAIAIAVVSDKKETE